MVLLLVSYIGCYIDLIVAKVLYHAETWNNLTLLHGCFSRFLNCKISTKPGKASYMEHMSTYGEMFGITFKVSVTIFLSYGSWRLVELFEKWFKAVLDYCIINHLSYWINFILSHNLVCSNKSFYCLLITFAFFTAATFILVEI